MNQFLLVVSFLTYKFCILSQNIRICFNIRITFFASERSNLHTTLHHLYSQASLTTPAKPVDVLGKALIYRLGCRGQQWGHGICLRSHSGLATAKPGTSTRARLGPTAHEDSAFDSAAPSSFLHPMFHWWPLLLACHASPHWEGSEERGLRESPIRRGVHRTQCHEQSWPDPHLLQLLRVLHDQRVRKAAQAALD